METGCLYRKEESVPRGFEVPAHAPARAPAGFPERREFDKVAADIGEVRRDRRIIQGRFGRRRAQEVDPVGGRGLSRGRVLKGRRRWRAVRERSRSRYMEEESRCGRDDRERRKRDRFRRGKAEKGRFGVKDGGAFAVRSGRRRRRRVRDCSQIELALFGNAGSGRRSLQFRVEAGQRDRRFRVDAGKTQVQRSFGLRRKLVEDRLPSCKGRKASARVSQTRMSPTPTHP